MTADLISWEKLYHTISACGKIHDVDQFCSNALTEIQTLCPYDRGLIYFLDTNGKVRKQYLVNISEHWSTMYLTYYSQIANNRFSITKGLSIKPPQLSVSNIDWEMQPKDEFMVEYIHRQGLKASLGFVLYDLNEIPRSIFALDRITAPKFSENEKATLQLLVTQLNHFYKKFFYQQSKEHELKRQAWQAASLTQRESEIAELLCQGISTNQISKTLFISPATTYRHIANIYEKMNVSSRQDLLVRLLN